MVAEWRGRGLPPTAAARSPPLAAHPPPPPPRFVSNLVFAKFVRKQTISWRMIIASALVVSGTSITVIFGPRDNHQFSITQLEVTACDSM